MPRRPIVLVLLIALVCASQSGCVRRRMTIRSNPPGALVYVDNEQVGITPVSVSYTYYATREIRLVADGYETVVEKHTFSPPWYQYPGLDFISENLWPFEVRDERIVNFDLAPQRIVPVEEVLARAENLRSNTRLGLATPIVPTMGYGTGVLPAPYEPPPAAIGVNRPGMLPVEGTGVAPPQYQYPLPEAVDPYEPQRLPYGGYELPH